MAAARSGPNWPTASFAVETASGARWTMGSGAPKFVIRTADVGAWRHLLRSRSYAVAKAFVENAFEIQGDILAAVRWWLARQSSASSFVMTASNLLNVETYLQSRSRAKQNIAFHYDRSNEFYQQFLDRRMVYSSAYFTDPSVSLDDAQVAKLDHILRKLDLKPDEYFLDIGCGWGALVVHAAERFNARATGCTLSARQFEYATQAIGRACIADRARIEAIDYRQVRGPFDKIASIGMYEHVGRHRLRQYFTKLASLMPPDGRLLNSGIARPETTRDDDTTTFLRRYVFPGGEIPCLADVIRAAEDAGLEVIDVENLRIHYGMTCAHWVNRLQEHREACLDLVDERTYRTWLLYLAGSAINFERGDEELYQILFAKRGRGPTPRLTRQYMYQEGISAF